MKDNFEENTLFYIVVALTSMASIDVISEVLDKSVVILSENWVKKIILFMFIYQTSKSIRIASLTSIIIILAFKDVFFNAHTTVRKPRQVTVVS